MIKRLCPEDHRQSESINVINKLYFRCKGHYVNLTILVLLNVVQYLFIIIYSIKTFYDCIDEYLFLVLNSYYSID